jgi:hypothetical protein
MSRSGEIGEGHPAEWPTELCLLRMEFPSLQIVGGCCGAGTGQLPVRPVDVWPRKTLNSPLSQKTVTTGVHPLGALVRGPKRVPSLRMSNGRRAQQPWGGEWRGNASTGGGPRFLRHDRPKWRRQIPRRLDLRHSCPREHCFAYANLTNMRAPCHRSRCPKTGRTPGCIQSKRPDSGKELHGSRRGRGTFPAIADGDATRRKLRDPLHAPQTFQCDAREFLACAEWRRRCSGLAPRGTRKLPRQHFSRAPPRLEKQATWTGHSS